MSFAYPRLRPARRGARQARKPPPRHILAQLRAVGTPAELDELLAVIAAIGLGASEKTRRRWSVAVRAARERITLGEGR